MGLILGVAKISNIFGGMPDIFFGETTDAVSEPMYQEKMRVPPGPLDPKSSTLLLSMKQ